MILGGLEAYAPKYLTSTGYSSLLNSFNDTNLDDQELLVQANSTLLDLEAESVAVYKVMKEGYSVRFPELATFELSSIQYARVILLLASEDPEVVCADTYGDLKSFGLDTSRITAGNTGLPNATVMIISVTAATTKGRPFTPEEWKSVREIAVSLVGMERVRKSILKFIESRMEKLAPNVTALVGVEVASQLVGSAGGIVQLSRIPAGNIQVIGNGGRKHLAGLSSASVGLHSGFIAEAPLMAEVAPEYKIKAQRLLSAKVSIASRVDAGGDYKDGTFGRNLYDEIVGKLEKLSEPAPLKTVKPLPIPDSERKKRRGGKRARKLKELYAQSEASKQKNRLAFGEKAEEEVFVGDRMEGLGMLGSGNLRALSGSSERETRLREHLKKQVQGKLATTGSSGMRSSIMHNGDGDSITLVNRTESTGNTNTATLTSKYFNLNSGFKRNKD
jgi:U4/U6 small nuclear ribonucleoprotein PRP31